LQLTLWCTILLYVLHTLAYYPIFQAQSANYQHKHSQLNHTHPSTNHILKPSWTPRSFWELPIYYLYANLSRIISTHSSSPLQPDTVSNKGKFKKLKHSHKSRKQRATCDDISFLTTTNVHSEPSYKCKNKNKRNKANPLHITRLYTLITNAHITLHDTPKPTIYTLQPQNIQESTNPLPQGTTAHLGNKTPTTKYPAPCNENHNTLETIHALPHPINRPNPTHAIPHTQAPTQPPPKHDITQNAKRNQRRRKSARLKPKSQPTPHNTFLAQLITARSLDSRHTTFSISNRNHKHTRIKPAQPLRSTRAQTNPLPKAKCSSIRYHHSRTWQLSQY
jgi:hypothetical protein